MRERSPVEARLYQMTKHLMDASPDTVERVVAGEVVTPTRDRPVVDMVFPPKEASGLCE